MENDYIIFFILKNPEQDRVTYTWTKKLYEISLFPRIGFQFRWRTKGLPKTPVTHKLQIPIC